jgi:hypothetical protein
MPIFSGPVAFPDGGLQRERVLLVDGPVHVEKQVIAHVHGVWGGMLLLCHAVTGV